MNAYSYEYKDFYINPSKEHPSVYTISTVGKGGKIPNILSGMYTKRAIAKQDIDLYLATKPVKEKPNAETINSGGSK